MKTNIILLIIILVIDLFLLGYFIHEFIDNNDYTTSMYIVTSKDGHTYFYELNDKGHRREVDRFDYDYENIYHPINCIESYIDDNKVLNRYTPDTCIVVDQYENEIEQDETMIDIIKEISKLKHDLLVIRINKTNSNYYVTVELNVNWFSPYDFYKYEDGKLKKILRLDNEDILYVKEK